MLSATFHEWGGGADALTFLWPSPGPWPLYAALTFYILSVKMAISLRPVSCYGGGEGTREWFYVLCVSQCLTGILCFMNVSQCLIMFYDV